MNSSLKQELLDAIEKRDIQSFQSILAKKKIDINGKDILTKNIHDIQNLFFHKIKSNKFDISFPETTFMYCNDKYMLSCELKKSKMSPLFVAIKKQNIEIV